MPRSACYCLQGHIICCSWTTAGGRDSDRTGPEHSALQKSWAAGTIPQQLSDCFNVCHRLVWFQILQGLRENNRWLSATFSTFPISAQPFVCIVTPTLETWYTWPYNKNLTYNHLNTSSAIFTSTDKFHLCFGYEKSCFGGIYDYIPPLPQNKITNICEFASSKQLPLSKLHVVFKIWLSLPWTTQGEIEEYLVKPQKLDFLLPLSPISFSN